MSQRVRKARAERAGASCGRVGFGLALAGTLGSLPAVDGLWALAGLLAAMPSAPAGYGHVFDQGGFDAVAGLEEGFEGVEEGL